MTFDTKNLVALDLTHSNYHADFWEEKGFFVAEDCMHQLIIGTQDDLKNVPPEILKNAAPANRARWNNEILETGPDAYKHILKASVGLLDKKIGQKITIDTMKNRWKNFLAGMPSTAYIEREFGENSRGTTISREELLKRERKFSSLVQNIFADCKMVRACAFEDRVSGNYLHPVSDEPAVAARTMMHIKPGDKVLVIADSKDFAISAIRELDPAFSKQTEAEAKTGGIYVTHSDVQICSKIIDEVKYLKSQGKIKGEVRGIGCHSAMQGLFKTADFVVNCRQMDNGLLDSNLLDAASKRQSDRAWLFHLKGDKYSNSTTDSWKEAGKGEPRQMMFIEDIKQQSTIAEAHNKEMEILALRAVDNCVSSRQENITPMKHHLLDESEQYKAGLAQSVSYHSTCFQQHTSHQAHAADRADTGIT